MIDLLKRKDISGKTKLLLSSLLLGVSVILFILSKCIDRFADVYYEYVYLTLVNVFSRAIDVIPFSAYEMILYIFIIIVFLKILIYAYLVITRKSSFKLIIIRVTANVLIYITMFIFLNTVTLGVNSFRTNFVTLTDLKIKDGSKQELIEICDYLKNKLNELDGNIERDEDGFLKVNGQVREEGVTSMRNLGEIYPFLKGFYPRPKPWIFSKLMSYQLLEGETDFTLEANYNNDMPKCNVPSTICHELSHIRGFNNEDEANYIGFLACINSMNYEYQYSGYLMAYSYCMNDLYEADLEAFKVINYELSNRVKIELRNDGMYWNGFRGRISKIHNDAYDNLLKLEGQENGIKSYNAVVKLLISGYKIQFAKSN